MNVRKWKIILMVVLSVILLSPTLKMALNNLVVLFLLAVIVRFLARFIRAFWIPLLFITAVIYLYT